MSARLLPRISGILGFCIFHPVGNKIIAFGFTCQRGLTEVSSLAETDAWDGEIMANEFFKGTILSLINFVTCYCHKFTKLVNFGNTIQYNT